MYIHTHTYMYGERRKGLFVWGLTPEGSRFSAQGAGWGAHTSLEGYLCSLCGAETWPLHAVIPRATRGRCGHTAAHQPPRRAATAPLGTVRPTEHSLLRLARATHRSPLAHLAVYTGSRRSLPQGGARRGSPALPAASVRCSAGGSPPAPLAASPALQAFWCLFCVLRVTGP